jgi:phospholipase D-like protein
MPVLADYPFWDAFWSIAVFFAFAIWIYLVIRTLVDLFGRHDLSGWAKVAWVVFICLIPLISVLTYLLVRPPEDQMRPA